MKLVCVDGSVAELISSTDRDELGVVLKSLSELNGGNDSTIQTTLDTADDAWPLQVFVTNGPAALREREDVNLDNNAVQACISVAEQLGIDDFISAVIANDIEYRKRKQPNRWVWVSGCAVALLHTGRSPEIVSVDYSTRRSMNLAPQMQGAGARSARPGAFCSQQRVLVHLVRQRGADLDGAQHRA